MRIAILDAAHWHVPLYLPAFRRGDDRVVAVSDRRRTVGPDLAARLGCASYADHRALLDAEKIDFAFVFGRHADMPGMAADLIDRDIPFAVEKPCGTCAADVADLRRRAEERGLYVAVPFILRLPSFLDPLRSALGPASAIQHVDLRFVAGPLARYEASGDGWMLDAAMAGGGCTINIGAHLVDLFLSLTGEPSIVAAHVRHGTPGASVEDYSTLVATSASGAVGTIVSGYTFAASAGETRDFSVVLAATDRYVRIRNGAFLATTRGPVRQAPETYPVSLDFDSYYPLFVDRALSDLRAGKLPFAGLCDAEAMLRVVDAAYASSRSGVPCAVRVGPAAAA